MNLSTSNSDDASAWGRCLAACLGTLAAGGLILLALMIAVDPYDSGRFGMLQIDGVNDDNPRFANASRARDPQFDSAVIGDSTAMGLNPAGLSETSGTHFVQLSSYGLDPREQLAMLDFFLRRHQHLGAVVAVTDMAWCVREPLPPLQVSFPFWLYGDSTLDYAAHLFSWHALEHLAQRSMIGLGRRKPHNPDGYVDYEKIWPPGQFRSVDIPKEMTPTAVGKDDASFPHVLRLDRTLKRLPADVPLVVVIPPTFHTLELKPGSIAAAEYEACSRALKRVVAGRPRGSFIDFRIDNALTRDPANFADTIHYRAKIARKMEQGIAASIRSGKSAKIDF
jgi:hypothetical protein